MMSIISISGIEESGNFAWRHKLTWRQLSMFWHLPVSFCSIYSIPNSTEPSLAYSIALSHNEIDTATYLEQYYKSAPVVVFLDKVRLCKDKTSNKLSLLPQRLYSVKSKLMHSFRLENQSPLIVGLPDKLNVLGPCKSFTPVQVDENVQILVWLENQPIVAFKSPHLFIGADPWQLGAPSVPMLYAILSNWLEQIVHCHLNKMKPYAVIRLDDLPTTAEKVMIETGPIGATLDRKRARTIRRLRKFAHREGVRLTLMYTSHICGKKGKFESIASAMPRSVYEIDCGVKQGVFEIGSHGMVHLRRPFIAQDEPDPREFMDLDEDETSTHLNACETEIKRYWGVKSSSFVAPAWGYRPGITKRAAAKLYSIIADSSQHMEDGTCNIMLGPGEYSSYMNITETFRQDGNILTYAEKDFWKYYAEAGIPVHYMQHTDNNWHLLRSFLKQQIQANSSSQGSLNLRVLKIVEDDSLPLYKRSIFAILLLTFNIVSILRHPAHRLYLWRVLTRSSLYSFAKAIRMAGYQCVSLEDFKTIVTNISLSHERPTVSGSDTIEGRNDQP